MIVIDMMERRSVVYKQLVKMGVEFEVRELDVGDYIVNGVCIERKWIDDYVSSLFDGRLHKQLYNMSYNFEYSVLIVEGYIDEVYSKINRNAYLSSLAGVIMRRADDGKQGIVHIIMLSSPFDTAKFIYYLDKKGTIRLPTISPKKKASSNFEIGLRILSAFPGISEVRAKALLEYFGSLDKIFNAGVDELIKVSGIGSKTAKSFYEIIRRDLCETKKF